MRRKKNLKIRRAGQRVPYRARPVRGGRGKKRITVTYSTVTPESAEEGDYADHGWIDEDGVVMTPDRVDFSEGVSAVAKAVEFLSREGATEPSSSHFHKGVWYSWPDAQPDYATGEHTTQSYHLEGFSPSEEREIFSRVTKRR